MLHAPLAVPDVEYDIASLLITSTRRGNYFSRSQSFVRQPFRLYALKAHDLPRAPPTMSELKQPPILIVGASIASLSLAATMQENNAPFQVLE